MNNLLETIAEVTKPINHLADYENKAIAAHRHTSFSPERRGNQMVNEFGVELNADIETLKSGGASEEVINDYISRYKRYFSSYLSAKSNCFSVMIVGPSGMNSRRHEKANRSEQKHYEVFIEWRSRAKKSILRKAKEPKTFLSESARYVAELEAMKRNHDKMKEGNKRISQARKTGEDISSYLIEDMGIKPHMVDWTLKFGFGLANSNANIKRLEERIKLMEAKERNANTIGAQELQYDGFIAILNHEADRIQIKHDEKPSYEVISKLKKNGFKWSPSNGVWQRQITANALFACRHYFGIDFKK